LDVGHEGLPFGGGDIAYCVVRMACCVFYALRTTHYALRFTYCDDTYQTSLIDITLKNMKNKPENRAKIVTILQDLGLRNFRIVLKLACVFLSNISIHMTPKGGPIS
jgi:hypothetical protein